MKESSPTPAPLLRHLGRLLGPHGLYEHARFDAPRPELGCCSDDAGRALAIACRLPADPVARPLAMVCLEFLERAYVAQGHFRLRLGASGDWEPGPGSDDAAGRAILGLGVAAAVAPWPQVRARSAALFDDAVVFRSEWARATAYATLGAVEVLGARPGHPGAHRLVIDAAERLPTPLLAGAWRWPEPRLSYANALLPEALLAAGSALGDPGLVDQGLGQLAWLVQEEMRDGHFSFTPVGGRGPDSEKPAFDQQPIEAWAMADACARAFSLSGQQEWDDALRRARWWFLGYNDTGTEMFDPVSGGGFDGLGPAGPNRNQGAESSLAFVATMLSTSP